MIVKRLKYEGDGRMHPLIAIYAKPWKFGMPMKCGSFYRELVASCFVPKVLVGFFMEPGINALLVIFWDNTSLEPIRYVAHHYGYNLGAKS